MSSNKAQKCKERQDPFAGKQSVSYNIVQVL